MPLPDPARRNANDRERRLMRSCVYDCRPADGRAACADRQVSVGLFEQFLWEGVEAYYSLIAEQRAGPARDRRCEARDIGTTATAYAAGHLADSPDSEGNDIILPTRSR